MLKIVEVHTSPRAQCEYVVLQNVGLVNVNLRGWALCTDAFLEADNARLLDEMYIFREDAQIKPYARVVLFTGFGENEWVPTVDGKQAFCVYWGRVDPVWQDASNVHVLHMLTTRRVVHATHAQPHLAHAN
jgi:hypothetical protein